MIDATENFSVSILSTLYAKNSSEEGTWPEYEWIAARITRFSFRYAYLWRELESAMLEIVPISGSARKVVIINEARTAYTRR